MIRLEQLRLDARLTHADLGEKAGVSGKTSRRIETNHRGQVGTLAKLSDHFNVPVSELLRDVAELERAA